MREKHHGTQPFFVIGQFGESLTKNLNQILQGRKDPIVQVFLSQLLSEMFDGIDFWTISRLKDQTNVLWNLQIFGPVPARLIDLPDHKVGGFDFRHMSQKDIHHGRVSRGQDEGGHQALLWSHRRVDRTGRTPAGAQARLGILMRPKRLSSWAIFNTGRLSSAERVARTILTTNFDAVLPDLCRERQRPHHVEIIKTPSDLTKFSTSPAYPQLIYLHGSIEHYSDKNLLDEVQRLDENLITQIFPLLRDHPLIVIGYRGAEPSIMRHLLLEHASSANYYRQGIFWCATRDSVSNGLHSLVNELAATIGGNFQVVPINGFDELLDELWTLHQRLPRLASSPPTALQGSALPAPTFDMEPLAGSSLEELDWSRVQTCIIDYCHRMETPVSSPVTRAWLVDRLHALDLAREQDGYSVPTKASYLLFARNPLNRIRSAQVALHVGGETERIFTGNLWNQLDQVVEALEEINRPFRLKGLVSETVFPYPSLGHQGTGRQRAGTSQL